MHLNIEMTFKSCETLQKSAQPSAKTHAADLQRPLIRTSQDSPFPSCPVSVCPSICSFPKWDRNVQHSTVITGMWFMWLHKCDSYRIINVEMQMKRGHPSAFVGASLSFLYMPELVGRSSRTDSSDWADRAVQKEWEDTPLWAKNTALSAWLTQLLLLTKMKQKHSLFFCLYWSGIYEGDQHQLILCREDEW